MQRSTLFLAFLALVVGFALFKVKYKVVDIEQQLAQAKSLIQQEQENIHMLQAEWSHLNDPKRLQTLAKQLDIGPVATTQVIALLPHRGADLPLPTFTPQPHLAAIHEGQ